MRMHLRVPLIILALCCAAPPLEASKFTGRDTGKPDARKLPHFWLFAPDDRAVPFDPATSANDLLRSPLRQRIQVEVSDADCTVLLLESSDETANSQAKARAEKVVEQVNQLRKNAKKTPAGPVKLLTLSVKRRPHERWTLWGLGEEVAVGASPRIAVIVGKMRRAGTFFEGTDWKETDLLERITSLEPTGEGNHHSQDIAWLKTQPPTLEEVMFCVQARNPDENDGQFEDPFQWEAPKETPPHVPSIFASTLVGVIFLIAGIIGWILLGLSAWILETRRTSASPS